MACCCRHSEDPGAHEQQPGEVPQVSPEPLGAAAPDLSTILLPVHGGCTAHCLHWSVFSRRLSAMVTFLPLSAMACVLLIAVRQRGNSSNSSFPLKCVS